jgi:NAD(P)-dependent dehydrogenase (short-subunit alcohol dehydrogenase family)
MICHRHGGVLIADPTHPGAHLVNLSGSSTMAISGKTIWLTGATSGIGRALALALAKMGNHVIASGRNEVALRQLSEDCHGAISPMQLDVTDASSIEYAGSRLSVITDSLDMVIANARDCEYLDPSHFDSAMIKRIMAVNFFGAVSTVELALPLLRKASRPQIVVVSSLSTLVAFGGAEAYGASKAALEYFARSLAIDLVPAKIAVSIVRPGFVATPLADKNHFAMPFMLSPEQASDRIIKGIDKRKAMIEFPRRLSWPLKLLAGLPALWYRLIAPRLSANGRTM